MMQADGSVAVDRYERFVRSGPAGAGRPNRAARLRHCNDVIFDANRDLFSGARVLDIMSSTGFWSYAAHQAGASHVLGIEPLPAQIEAAKHTFSDDGVNTGSYQFVKTEIAASLRTFDPKMFDIVMSHGFLEQSDPRFFFQQMNRLRTKYVLLDTAIVQGKGPIVRFRQKPTEGTKPKAMNRYNSVLSIPNHEMVVFFCDYFQFSWRLVDWKSKHITDWTGLNDYEQDHRRTYILERLSAAGK